jgi:hypothetical protein
MHRLGAEADELRVLRALVDDRQAEALIERALGRQVTHVQHGCQPGEQVCSLLTHRGQLPLGSPLMPPGPLACGLHEFDGWAWSSVSTAVDFPERFSLPGRSGPRTAPSLAQNLSRCGDRRGPAGDIDRRLRNRLAGPSRSPGC